MSHCCLSIFGCFYLFLLCSCYCYRIVPVFSLCRSCGFGPISIWSLQLPQQSGLGSCQGALPDELKELLKRRRGLSCLLALAVWSRWVVLIPSGKLTKNYGKSPFLMGKSTISMVIFNSYVKLPEGIDTTDSIQLERNLDLAAPQQPNSISSGPPQCWILCWWYNSRGVIYGYIVWLEMTNHNDPPEMDSFWVSDPKMANVLIGAQWLGPYCGCLMLFMLLRYTKKVWFKMI